MTQEVIKSLTPEQEALFPVYREKWRNIGLSTEPVDLEKAKQAAILAYECAGLPAPTQFFLVDSPVAAIKFIQELDPSLSKEEIYNSMIYGFQDAFWLAFYDYMKEVLNIECCNKLNGLFELSKYSGWLNVYEDVVVFQQKPEYIKFDEDDRLHCETGPAIRYRDGFSVYAWHGTRIPGEWIENRENLDVTIALTWENVEQRRCACEIIGWAKVLEKLNAKIINEDEDPQVGVLLEVELPDVGKERFLRVLCGTGREFALPVPPNMETALQANAWTFGMDDFRDWIKPEVRT